MFPNRSVKIFTLKNSFLITAKVMHSIRMCLTVQGVWQVKHCGCGFCFKMKEWVSLVWPIRNRDITTCSLLDFLDAGLISPEVGCIWKKGNLYLCLIKSAERGAYDNFQTFFRMGTFIDSTLMKLYSPFEVISSGCNALVVPFQQLLEGPMEVLLCERVNDPRHSLFHLLNVLLWTTTPVFVNQNKRTLISFVPTLNAV